MYVITGASGHIGSKITANLLEKGKKVRMIGRTEDKLKNISENRADVDPGDIGNTEFLTDAFKGADGVFAMIPPNMGAADSRGYQRKMADSIVTAIKNSGVKKVVALSSMGAHRGDGVGIVGGLHDFEEKLKKLEGVDVVMLRAGYFMENTFMMIGSLKKNGTVALPLKPDKKMPMIATRDIAETATKYLLDDSWSGKQVHYLLGERDLSYNDIIGILKKELGRDDLKYQQIGYDDIKNALTGSGATESIAEDYVGLMEGVNEGRLTEDVNRTPETTTKTSFEDFAKVFAAAYNA